MPIEQEPQPISSQITEFLDQPPSCLEFCPQNPNYLVIGTYLLTEEKRESTTDGAEIDPTTSTTTKQTKTGSLQLWHLDYNQLKLQQKQLITLPHAVFDLHFHPQRPTFLGVAGSDGSVSLYSVSTLSSHHENCQGGGDEFHSALCAPHIELVWTRHVHDEGSGIPALYLTWFPEGWFPRAATTTKSSTTTNLFPDGFAVTFSDGRTSVFRTPITQRRKGGRGNTQQNDISKGNEIDLIETNFEPRNVIETWFVALATYQETESGKPSSFIFTGDDFGSLNTLKFEAPDSENGEDDDDDGDNHDGEADALKSCMTSNTNDRARHHTAGVTSILPLPIGTMVQNAPVLLTGSYDEYIRVYHATSRCGSILAEKRLGGGVWRLQVIQTNTINMGSRSRATTVEETGLEIEFLILASCMHAGSRIVKVTWNKGPLASDAEIGDWDIKVLAKFTENESMNYASGVWKGNETTSDLVCVSSSFYDRRLCLWKTQI